MKTAVIVDFDTRRILFQKIVGSLKLLPSIEDWDLNWGEPFIAVTKDRRVWVRVFYEESLPASAEKLKNEIERLKPHLPEDGELCVCVPRAWGFDREDWSEQFSFRVRLWSYSSLGNGFISATEAVAGPVAVVPAQVRETSVVKPMNQILDQRLDADEVRELAEMGVALKRFRFQSL